ncbi:hypothetical protein LJC68_10600 [Bacteroidales bacterium OttesenSCG-928-B11]|nr:hypothetical protein [Bacteroidales bacterium OttesenSCG-928-B11]
MAALNSFGSFSSSVITAPEGIVVEAKKKTTGEGCYTTDERGPGLIDSVYYSSDTEYYKKGVLINTKYNVTRYVYNCDCDC